MKTFEIELTQNLKGYYRGILEIEAKNKKEAEKILKSMTKDELDEKTDWSHGDEYYGDVDIITFNSELEEV